MGLIDNQAQIPWVQNAHARPNERGQRHDGDAAHVFEHATLNWVVCAIHHHVESVVDQCLGRFQCFGHIGKQVVGTAQYLEFHKFVAVKEFTGQP